MNTGYHPGELEAQTRAGRRDEARRVCAIVHTAMPSVAQEFLRTQQLAAAGSVASDARVWASLVAGPPGFMRAADDRTIDVERVPGPPDPLQANLRVHPQIGFLVIDPLTRRRMRVNGTAALLPGGGLRIHASHVYSNCGRYIQARAVAPPGPAGGEARVVYRGTELTPSQACWIGRADTCFVATAHPTAGADVSHKGGNPGFLRVLGPQALSWPDYPGNSMFNTLGNLAVNPKAGLLLLDFERGSTLQLTGQARVQWDPGPAAGFAGAQRAVELHLDDVLEVTGATSLRWTFVGYSPFNPA